MRTIPILLVFILTATASARTMIIPNLYKNRREAHRSGAAAGWSDRRSVGLDHTTTRSEDDTESETKTKEISPHVFYHFDSGVTTELGYSKSNEKTDGDSDEDITDLNVNLGFRLPAHPGSLGLQISNEKIEEDGAEDIKENTLGVSYVHKINDSIYVGAGVNNTDTDFGDENDDDDAFAGGVGFISGDMKRPDIATEITLTFTNEEGTKTQVIEANALANIGEVQPFGTIFYGQSNSDIFDVSVVQLVGGVDYGLGQFYVAPDLTLFYADYDYDFAPGGSYISSTQLGLEGGYRVETFDAYLRLAKEQEKQDSGEFDVETTSIQIGGNYLF